MKSLFSDDGGISWNNISGILPNVPANTIVLNELDSLKLFIRNDLGVFIKIFQSLNNS